MFIIELTYKKSLDEVDQYVAEHRVFLDNGYKSNYFITSGPKIPRTGGIFISHLKNREQLENIIKQDPFNIHDLADYRIIEFNPTKYHADFRTFVVTGTSEVRQ